MNLSFLQKADYLTFIDEAALEKICRHNAEKLSQAENYAYGYVFEKLSARYDIEEEISRPEEDRNPVLVRWMVVIAVYFLYQAVPDDEIPERVRLNFEDVTKEISRVGSGRENCTFIQVTNKAGRAKTKFRWASNPRRTHNPFS